jgi:hypothetical protein
MHAFETWNDFSEELNHQILDAAYTHNKKMYKNLLNDAAGVLNKRPTVVQEIPRKERHQLFKPFLGNPAFGLVSQNLLLNWLAFTQRDMIIEFLDLMNISHDGQGYVDNFPEVVDEKKLKSTVDALYKKYPKENVNAYLKAFDSITGQQWKQIDPLIQS